MNIKTKFKISAAISIVVLLVLCSIVYLGVIRMNELYKKEQITQQIVKGAFDLSLLTNDYLLFHGERSKAQWHIKHDDIANLLKSGDFNNPGEAPIIDGIQADHEDIKEIFSALAESVSRQGSGAGELEGRLVGQLQVKSQSIVSGAFSLKEVIYSDLAATQKRLGISILAITSVLIAIMISNTVYISRSLSKSIGRLSEVAKQIGMGNFDVKAGIDSKDEFGDLANAIDVMVVELKKLDFQKNQFISIAAHELKTPLTSIKGFSDLLQANAVRKDKKKTDSYLKIIVKDTNRLDNLVTHILDLSRMDIGTLQLNYQKIDIGKTIGELREEVSVIIKNKKLKAVYDIEKNLPQIEADKEKLIQVLSNLILNAVHYTEKGEVTISAARKDSFVLFGVADTGIGIPKEHLGKLFTRFYQVDNPLTRKINGAGLGLALSKGFVESMGGKIWVESEVDRGSVFRFMLPIERPENVKKDVNVVG